MRFDLPRQIPVVGLLCVNQLLVKLVDLTLTLHLIYLDYATSAGADGRYQALAEHYGRVYEDAWGRLTFAYDEADDNKPDPNRRTSGVSTFWLSSRGNSTGYLP